MIIPDLIVTWPRNCDYPLWRQMIRDHRERFNEIIVVFMETNRGENYRDFVKEAMFTDHILFIENYTVEARDDWRDRAIHRALLHSYNAPWVLFTEQDFLPTDFDRFWEVVDGYEGYDAIGVMQETRIHPCFLLMKREALNRTRKCFGVVRDKLDHFGLIQADIQNPEYKITFTAVPDYPNRHDYSHMNGLSHNLTLFADGKTITYKPEEFTNYLEETLKVSVPLDPRYVGMLAR